MKKSLSILLAVFMFASSMLTACGAKPAVTTAEPATEAPVTVATEASAATEAPAATASEDTTVSMVPAQPGSPFDINGKTLIKETAQGFKEEIDFIDRTNSRMRGIA